ncbi:SRPBCC family protein [Leucobacter soli]|uniref:hypothetical protein n=1 Tax=Leucobacter soli TaxID=2812850 RepID=UPI00361FF2F8
MRHPGDVFTMRLTTGGERENRVVEFEEGRRIAWLPTPPGEDPPGHLWRWELEPLDGGGTRVRHSYDWTALHDPKREARARSTTAENLRSSIDRLAELAERGRAAEGEAAAPPLRLPATDQMIPVSSFSIMGFGMAPMISCTSSPPLNTFIAGMEVMR